MEFSVESSVESWVESGIESSIVPSIGSSIESGIALRQASRQAFHCMRCDGGIEVAPPRALKRPGRSKNAQGAGHILPAWASVLLQAWLQRRHCICSGSWRRSSHNKNAVYGPCLLLTEALQKIAKGALEDTAPPPKRTLAMHTYCGSAWSAMSAREAVRRNIPFFGSSCVP